MTNMGGKNKGGKKNAGGGEGEKGKKAKRDKKPWKVRQAIRTDKAVKTLSRLADTFLAAKAPNMEPTLAQNALSAMQTFRTQLTLLPDDWKPEKGASPGTDKKIGIGSIINAVSELDKDDANGKRYFAQLPQSLFEGGKVVEDFGREWLIECKDEMVISGEKRFAKRVLKKKYAVLANVVEPKKES
jgi:hypothetical protein